jgi:ubiquinone/menaquinone biosynthesis C-methylase UbiE
VERYVIRGGHEGYKRLQLLAAALGPHSRALFDRVGVAPGARCLDVGCGGGEVSFELARRVGPSGHVLGMDMDEVKLSLARHAAVERGLEHVEFRAMDVYELSEPAVHDLVYCRMLLQHLSRPVDVLRRMWEAVAPGGAIVVEDADFYASFCEPPNPGFEFFLHTYCETLERRGGDPAIGLKLFRYFREAGIPGATIDLVQRVDAAGDAKWLPHSTLAATEEAIVAEGIATAGEVATALAALADATADPAAIIGLPRTFQIWARRDGQLP